MCEVSVIMPVYNCEKYIGEAINSILNQSFKDFEFIIINDCSTDKTREIITSYIDNRIMLIDNNRNLGLSESLNKGLALAKGKYIARMDGDDIAYINRLELQYNFMEENKEVGLCGSSIEVFNSISSRIHKCPVDHDEIRVLQLFNSAFAHPVVMIRNSILKKYNLRYDKYYDGMEDYHLWIRISELSRVANLDKVLLKYREHENQVTKNYTNIQLKRAWELRKSNLIKISPDFNDEEINIFFEYCQNTILNNEEKLIKVFSIFDKILSNNIKYNLYNQEMLKHVFSYNVYWSILNYKKLANKKLRYKQFAHIMSPFTRIKAIIKYSI